jgi:subtilisin family serine protease
LKQNIQNKIYLSLIGLIIMTGSLGCGSKSGLEKTNSEPPFMAGLSGNNRSLIKGEKTDLTDQYIVRLDDEADPEEVVREHGIEAKFIYQHAIKGFAGKISLLARTGLMADKRVVEIEPDQLIFASAISQSDATWGLDRIDQRTSVLDSFYNYEASGSGVTAYIIDTGILTSHEEFEGRASIGFDSVGDGRNGQDCNGHGTHVAGTVGGKTYGVAKAVKLVAVRVLDCNGSGYNSGVIAGVDWVAKQTAFPAVANMSLGGGASISLDSAVQKMIFAGVVTSLAAGNENKDACTTSPARVSDAMTIGASSSADARASWSNYGSCVDWFAPGVSIISAGISSNSASTTKSGTSMASPHVAGVAALYLELHPEKTSIEVRDALLGFSTKNIITNANSTNNHLLHSLEVQNGSGDFISPSVLITSPADGLVAARRSTITLTATAADDVGGGGVQRVEFFANGSRICTDTTVTYSCSYRLPNVRSATLLIQAKAFDAAGNVGSSKYISIRVQ